MFHPRFRDLVLCAGTLCALGACDARFTAGGVERVDQRCAQPGPLEVGAPCGSSADCTSCLCIPSRRGNVCGDACLDDGDCSDGAACGVDGICRDRNADSRDADTLIDIGGDAAAALDATVPMEVDVGRDAGTQRPRLRIAGHFVGAAMSSTSERYVVRSRLVTGVQSSTSANYSVIGVLHESCSQEEFCP